MDIDVEWTNDTGGRKAQAKNYFLREMKTSKGARKCQHISHRNGMKCQSLPRLSVHEVQSELAPEGWQQQPERTRCQLPPSRIGIRLCPIPERICYTRRTPQRELPECICFHVILITCSNFACVNEQENQFKSITSNRERLHRACEHNKKKRCFTIPKTMRRCTPYTYRVHVTR